MDGTSLYILIGEFIKLYKGESIDSLPLEYKDYSVWENTFINSEEFKKSEKYWLDKFKNSDFPEINLPYDYSPATVNYSGSKVIKHLDNSLLNDVNKYAHDINISPYMLYLSAFLILLYKYTGQDEIIIGTPFANRNNTDLQNLIGMFVNNLSIDAKIDSSKPFSDFVSSIKTQIINDIDNGNYPYDSLVKQLNLSNRQLFNTMFTYQNTEKNIVNINGKNGKLIPASLNISKFNLSFEINPADRNLIIEYRTDLFKESTIQKMYSHYINTINYILNNNNVLIKDIKIISEKEESKILYEFNNTKMDYPKDKTIIELFEEQVKEIPNNIAIVFENKKMTYKELNEKANQLANKLKNENLHEDDIIGIYMDKSLEMIVAILAILKNRCAYLPIDISTPTERIEYIFKDSNTRLILTTQAFINSIKTSTNSICIDLNSDIYNNNNVYNLNLPGISHDLAYIMYTSGSTGNPKGVMVENSNVIRLVKNTNYINLSKSDRILQTGSFAFDACTFEIWGALLNGLKLYIIRKELLLDSTLLGKYIHTNKINILWLTAPLFNQICSVNPNIFANVKYLLTGGDVLSPEYINLVKRSNPNLTVINGYGPTENTTFSCCYKIDKFFKHSIPIGYPISNSTCYIVSKDGNLQPIGIPGELWVGGDGVSRGYLNKPDLTQEKFIMSDFSNKKIYKTGDLVKWLKNGAIEFLGRIDNQIKLRGFRIELNEISLTILKYPKIREAFTICKNINNTKTICSYIVSNNIVNIKKLKLFLSKNLPTYMIPSYFLQIQQLPLNQNGKINKNLLPDAFETNTVNKELKLPRNEIEEKLYNIFKNILNYDNLSITDNFFNIGGDSISAMKLQIAALNNNLNITYADIFSHPSIEELSNLILNTSTDKKISIDEKKLISYNSILSNNTIENLEHLNILANESLGNILLTGVTGFLGIHILDSYMKQTNGIIYCLIRNKNNISSLDRLRNALHFYFDNKYDSYIGTRIQYLDGDITLDKFGLNNYDYNKVTKSISTVIHSAALVKHFGNFKNFEKINIIGTQKVVDFCLSNNLKLLHISTMSVSGNMLDGHSNKATKKSKDSIIYDETKLYIKQDLNNLYVRSKFTAETIVLNAIQSGLNAYILRMGNLTSRYSDGKFQKNYMENAFLSRIRAFIELGCIPDCLKGEYIEFSPIDFCADAIITIAKHFDGNFNMFHIYNSNYISINDIVSIFNNLGINIKFVNFEYFADTLSKKLANENESNSISGIVRDLDNNKQLNYDSKVLLKNDFSKEFLNKMGFQWPIINNLYIKKYLDYMIKVGYLNIKIKEQ